MCGSLKVVGGTWIKAGSLGEWVCEDFILRSFLHVYALIGCGNWMLCQFCLVLLRVNGIIIFGFLIPCAFSFVHNFPILHISFSYRF